MPQKVAVVKYEKPLDSVRKVVELSAGLAGASSGSKVFIKPNIVFWTKTTLFPKWGVVTTSRVIHDMVLLLKERGIDDITIGEGTVVFDPKDTATAEDAFKKLGYDHLRDKFGVKRINVLKGDFKKIDLGDGIQLAFSTEYLNSDFLVNIPVMKTHAQTVVSLGIKNIKGLININSRKKCHSAIPDQDLHYMVAKLARSLPPSFTLIDGIYSNERGPGFDGRIHRSNILIGSSDTFSADKTGAVILGFDPESVPHLAYVARDLGRTTDLSDVELVGEDIEQFEMNLNFDFPYNEDDSLPMPLVKMGLKGVSYHKYDLSMCTYCSLLTGAALMALIGAWKGKAWDDVEILTGKVMNPDPTKKHSILIGKCLFDAHKNHPDKDKLTFIKSCPPAKDEIVSALQNAGIDVDPAIFQHLESAPGFYMKRYEGKPEFDESHFRIG